MKKTITTLLLSASIAFSSNVLAADYVIDTQGAHASINFKIMHAGFSWLTGRFNRFQGNFSYDKDNLAASSVSVEIDTESVDTNHAKRDKHLRSADFLEVDKFPKANFVSTKFVDKGNGKMEIVGDFTMHGVTKSITVDAQRIAEGERKGKYLAGFAGTAELVLRDYNIKRSLGPASESVFLELHIEGIRQ
ncbi:MAG: YceI family protein [Arenicella sp.]